MKNLFKSVVASLVAMFLAASLAGCFDGGAKSTLQGGGGTDPSRVKLVFKPGMKTVSWIFPSENVAKEQSSAIRNVLKSGGIPIKDFIVSGDPGRGMVWVEIGQIQSDVTLYFSKENLESIAAVSVLNEVTQWYPSFGDEARLVD